MVNSHSRFTMGHNTYANAASTSFQPIGCGAMIRGREATETRSQVTYRTAGVFTNLLVNCTTHTSSTVVTTRKAAGAGAQTITVAATGITEDTTHSDTVTAADKWDIEFSALASTFAELAVTFAATTNTATRLISVESGTAGAGGSISVAGSYWMALGGFIDVSTATESLAQINMLKAGTLTNMLINVVSNSAGTGSTLISRVGGAAGNLTLTVAAAGTGIVEDTTHTDTVSVNDLRNLQLTITSGTTIAIITQAVDFTSTNGDSMAVSSEPGGSTLTTTFAANASGYVPFGGDLTHDATEAHAQITARDAFTASNLSINVQTNTVTASSTLTYRINTANGNQIITIGSSTTGLLSDTTDTDTTTATSDINAQLAAGATGTSIKADYIAVWNNIGGVSGTPTLPDYYWDLQQFVEF
jgi:hypothetical protein